MSKLAAASLASTFILAACASAPMATTSGGNSPMASNDGVQYCWKRNLTESGGKLYCNWVSERGHACTNGDSTPLDAARFSAPAPSGRCETGEYLVKVMPR